MIGAEDATRDTLAVPETADLRLDRETIVRWSGVACLYAGTAAALACLWSPI